MSESGGIDQRLVRALSHPLRVRILRLLSEGVASPNEMATELDETLVNVSYHTKVLKELDYIEEVRQKPRRGVVEHFYRARPDSSLGSTQWRQIPANLQSNVLAASLDAFTSHAIAAIEAKSFQDREGSTLVWEPVAVDERGWREILDILNDVGPQLSSVAEKSRRRLGTNDGTSVIVAFGAFAAPERGTNG